MTIRGAIGSVRWGYHRAADVRHWRITRAQKTKTLQLTGSVVRADAFLGARSDLHFVAQLKGGRTWQWPIEELHIGAGVVTARLGPIMDSARTGGTLVHA